MSPQKIAYVSCDPVILARNLKILNDLGYKTLEAQPVDMFPQTTHAENAILLQRRNPWQMAGLNNFRRKHVLTLEDTFTSFILVKY